MNEELETTSHEPARLDLIETAQLNNLFKTITIIGLSSPEENVRMIKHLANTYSNIFVADECIGAVLKATLEDSCTITELRPAWSVGLLYMLAFGFNPLTGEGYYGQSIFVENETCYRTPNPISLGHPDSE